MAHTVLLQYVEEYGAHKQFYSEAKTQGKYGIW